jgi:hypothetical protein
MTTETALARLINFFENVSPKNVDTVLSLYSGNAYFKDPFNEVSGHAAIVAIFRHMFSQVDNPRFLIKRSIVQEDDAFLVWDFQFQMKGTVKQQSIHGSSHLHFNEDKKIDYHRDYWDAAEELYEKIPVLGSLMRLLKCKVRR